MRCAPADAGHILSRTGRRLGADGLDHRRADVLAAGCGRYFVLGALNRDYTLVMGTVVLISVFIVVLNLIVDIIYAFVDPRIRHD